MYRVLWLNVYEVTQGYGGPEEGGQWYDIGVPLASVPFEAKLKEVEGCRCLHPHDPPEFCTDGCRCDCHGPERGWLEPVDPAAVERERARLKELFDSEPHRPAHSAAGDGYDIRIYLEDEIAQPYPDRKPVYS